MFKTKTNNFTAICYDWPLSRLREYLSLHDYQSFGRVLGDVVNRSELFASKLLQRTYMQLPFMQHDRVDPYHPCAQEFFRGFTQSLNQSQALVRDYDDYFKGAYYSANLKEFVKSREIWQRFDDLVQKIPHTEPCLSSTPLIINFQQFQRSLNPKSGR